MSDNKKFMSLANSYDILIGRNLVSAAMAELLPFIENRQIILISDEQVGPLYFEKIENALTSCAYPSALVPAGEASKLCLFEKLVTRYWP